MQTFHLEVWTDASGDPAYAADIDAADQAALDKGIRDHIGGFFERPQAFIELVPDHETFTIGAGFWSRRGAYRVTSSGDRSA